MSYLDKDQIQAYAPYQLTDDGKTPVTRAQERMVATEQWHPAQLMGRRWSIGCVALEITQRCNLDCTLCYLSESSEALKDIPLEEVYRRIDMILAHYGPNTDVQVTGGDPTLRKRDELVAIVRRISERGMRPSLLTNGIKATRDMLEELAGVGLVDVAFHVDMTQERKGYANEMELNEIRLEYIERARDLPISVFFNTTVYDGNFYEITDLVKFFVAQSDVVRFVSFQLQADTGRGVLHERGFDITQATVTERINEGAGTKVHFGAIDTGHPSCNRYGMTLVANGNVYDLMDEPGFIAAFLDSTAHLTFDRTNRKAVMSTLFDWAIKNPRMLTSGLGWTSKKLWNMKADMVKAKGKVNKLTFFIHNFMDACHLDKQRIDACVFMVATRDGPISMCLHNAKRDQYLLQPIEVKAENKLRFWNPVTGKLQDSLPNKIEVRHTRKTARGRAKVVLEKERAANHTKHKDAGQDAPVQPSVSDVEI
jgi:7,8-dihydro-6-hydroxymethylpterin dimethyltransferase